jgi:hypothetical protein
VSDNGAEPELPDEVRPDEVQPEESRKPFGLTTLGISVIVLLIVGAIALFTLGHYHPPPGSAAPTNTEAADAAAANVANVAVAPATVPGTFSPDDLVTAFAVVYAGHTSETDANGSTLVLTPRRVIPVKDSLVALISEGVRDRGADGSACEACTGDLRIDYLVWNGTGFALPAKATRFDAPGAAKGAPPTWQAAGGPGLPTLTIKTSLAGAGCVATRLATVRLTPAGVVQTGEKRRGNCAADGLPPPPPPPPPPDNSPPT